MTRMSLDHLLLMHTKRHSSYRHGMQYRARRMMSSLSATVLGRTCSRVFAVVRPTKNSIFKRMIFFLIDFFAFRGINHIAHYDIEFRMEKNKRMCTYVIYWNVFTRTKIEDVALHYFVQRNENNFKSASESTSHKKLFEELWHSQEYSRHVFPERL